jgi:outer membrane protein assembly factor BamC
MNLKHLLWLGIFAASGCSTVNSLLDSDSNIDYKSSKAAQKLEVPPDLTQLRTNERFNSARAASAASPSNNSASNSTVLPVSNKVRMERLGSSRFLVVDAPAEQVFPIVANFWKEAGFTLAIESPQTGLVETDWAENRVNAPASGLRKLMGGVLDGLFDSGERDQYRTRMERVGNTTEIYLSHKGSKEVNQGTSSNVSIKTIRRDGNVELESEFLRRLMLRFGAQENAATTATTAANAGFVSAPEKARLIAGNSALEIDDAYDAAWRRVALALDRSGFTIDDRNFSTGEFFIRYARDLNAANTGFFGKLFSNEKKDTARKLKLVLEKGSKSILKVQSETGAAVEADISRGVLTVLRDELK